MLVSLKYQSSIFYFVTCFVFSICFQVTLCSNLTPHSLLFLFISFFFPLYRGLLLQENSRFSEALHYYKLAIGSRPTLACKYFDSTSLYNIDYSFHGKFSSSLIMLSFFFQKLLSQKAKDEIVPLIASVD